jgi:tetratricopeptide (TPR) repeat protein
LSRAILKISAGFLVLALALLTTSLYLSERYLQSQQRLAAAGDIEGAMEAADEAARLDPFSTGALQAQASMLQNDQRFEDAEAVWRRAIRRDPNNYLMYMSLGNLQMTMGRYEEAEKNFREARRLNPMASTATASIAQTLVRRGDLEGAKVEYEKLYETNEIDTMGLYDLGRIYVRTGEPREGYKAITRAIRRAEEGLEGLEEPIRSQQEELIESMKLAAADALVVQRRYDAAYRQVSESSSEQAPALLRLISTDPEGYRESVVNSEIY